MSTGVNDFKDATFSETTKLCNIEMNEYAIAKIEEAIIPQDIISCSAIFFEGKDTHAVIHYPAGLLINFVAYMQFENNKDWYRTSPIKSEIDFAKVSGLNNVFDKIKTNVQPTRCGVFTPQVKGPCPLGGQQERQDTDSELIELMIKQMFRGIKFEKYESIGSFNNAHGPKGENR